MSEEIVDVSMTNISISKFTAPGRRSKCIPSKCKTCGAPALYKYFGVISCHSCKMFFKRNAKAGSVCSDTYCFYSCYLFIYLFRKDLNVTLMAAVK